MYIYRGTKYDPSKQKQQKPVNKAELVYRGQKIKEK
jgi:hypothetical protein